MPKRVSSFELTLSPRPAGGTLTRWLLDELRRAVLEGRLRPGTRFPSSRDFARQYGVSRGAVVSAFEQLQMDGYLCSRVGAGTWVNQQLPQPLPGARAPRASPGNAPAALAGLASGHPARPFRVHEPAIAKFPADVWARVAGRRLRGVTASLLAGGDPRGFAPLRRAIAGYLASSRGVSCSPDQIVILSGVQQGLDLLARLLLKAGETVWLEDPGYFGAALAFANAGARIVPVPVDRDGLSVREGRKLAADSRLAYVTPAHQFPLGMAMSIERRFEILGWACESGAYLIEDDYDSEFRFEGRPVPALHGLDRNGRVILLGTFNKLMFPALRLGYAVLPDALVDPFLSFRYGADLHGSSVDQAVLCDFIVEGHLGRHIRRMRELYAGRLAALLDAARRRLNGLLDVSPVQAGLYTAAMLRNGMSSELAENVAAAKDVETMGFHRFTLGRRGVQGLLLGFAAFEELEIDEGIRTLASALDQGRNSCGV